MSEFTVSVDKDAEEEKLMDASGGEVISVQEEAARQREPQTCAREEFDSGFKDFIR